MAHPGLNKGFLQPSTTICVSPSHVNLPPSPFSWCKAYLMCLMLVTSHSTKHIFKQIVPTDNMQSAKNQTMPKGIIGG